MEEKQLNEKESLELIARMIQNTQRKLEKGNGLPFLTWGYTTVAVSLLVWYLFSSTGNPYWNYLWFLIPVIGFPTMMLIIRKQEKGVKTYIDRIIGYVWIAFGIAGLAVSTSAVFVWNLPILFIIVLMMGTGTAITGMIIRFKPIIFSGFAGMLFSFLCLIVKGYDSILVFALIFLVMMVIPGHILNWKGRKNV
ncbi:hypothetical protein [Proteiniphilum sp. X52]|uniref:hypothetical protein n=1 Tax=Proteiniphilum sp. X52 TaxID=2382159 RepID=UPI000F09CC9D|nr:hypothetical protein [Proteiniphilum sp. X52]RNC64863.1 hypothetical protein D7D25_09570 [Proteiniphilum sp. X52]